jgi:hypothetical protein
VIDGQPLTPLQRVSTLLLNVPREQRRPILQCVDRPLEYKWYDPASEQRLDSYARNVARSCYRAVRRCEPRERWKALHCSEEVADLLERQQDQFDQQQSEAQIVATIPRFLFLAGDGALPPVEHGSLRTGMRDVLFSAREQLDICIPFISVAGADDLLTGLKRGSRRGMRARILSLLMDDPSGACRVAERLDDAGAHADMRSPTKEEALMIDALAPMHAKLIGADRARVYLGNGNISLAAFYRALEIGVIVKGALARNLTNLYHWTFIRHQQWGLAA